MKSSESYLALVILLLNLIMIMNFVKPKACPNIRESHPKRVLLIGGGGGRGNIYMKALNENSDLYLGGVVKNRREITLPEASDAVVYHSLDEALTAATWEVAVVSLPHGLHSETMKKLIEHGIPYIVKEKPLCVNEQDLHYYDRMIKSKTIHPIITTTQRTVLQPFLQAYEALALKHIGLLESFRYTYILGKKGSTSGWRAKKEFACGGTLLDMGYHALKEIIIAFGFPNDVGANLTAIDPELFAEGLEEMVELDVTYEGGLKGTVLLDAHGDNKEEIFFIRGSEGSISISRDGVEAHFMRYDADGKYVEKYTKITSKVEEAKALLAMVRLNDSKLWEGYEIDRQTSLLIEQIYESNKVKLFAQHQSP